MAAIPIIPPECVDEPPVATVFNEFNVFKAGKYLTFRVARQDFAISTALVRGILPLHQMIAVESGHYNEVPICGFAAVGGRDFPVIDLKVKLEIANGPHGREPFIIAVEAGGRLVGFVADRVSEVLDLRQRHFRNGALRAHGRPRKVLDPDAIMTTEDWSVFGLSLLG
jgi:chemotaxis signal transduction protein